MKPSPMCVSSSVRPSKSGYASTTRAPVASAVQPRMSSRLREDTTARLERHRALGHTVVLASASLDAYLEPLGALLGADEIVCTRLERDANGLLTGRLAGANCRGPEKARRVRTLLQARGLAGAEVWAYGDSADDDALLASVDHPLRVDGVRVVRDP